MEGGTAHGWERNLCVLGCPLPPYIKEQGGDQPTSRACLKRGVLLGLLVLVGFHQEGERGKEEEGEGEGKGGTDPLP